MLTHVNSLQRSQPHALKHKPVMRFHTGRKYQQEKVRNILRAPVVQAKLKIGAPNDKYEQEADRVAEQVMRMPTPASNDTIARTLPKQRLNRVSLLQRSTEAAIEDDLVASDSEPVVDLDEEQPLIQTKLAGESEAGVNPVVQATNLHETAASGHSIDAATRSYMEPRFGFDFSAVRVHHDSASDRFTRGLGAAALAHGHHIYFRTGRYTPRTLVGQQLLAHELTHVIQQSGGDYKTDDGGILRRSLLKGAPDRPQISSIKSLEHSIQMKPEVEVKLSEPNKVRIIDGGKVTKQWNKASAGHKTVSLMNKKASYKIYHKRKAGLIIGKWGLNYFAMFNGGYGFHSNIAMKKKKGGGRKKVLLKVDGKLRSHGCIRLLQNDAKDFYNSVIDGKNGTPINLMTNFSKLGGKKGGSKSSVKPTKGGTKSHVVKSGDTLSNLAQFYGVSQEAIEKANQGKIRGKKKVINIGDTLIIP